MPKAIAIIPARYQSTRFPGKPLAPLGGKPMLRHVYENVCRSGLFHKVVIATDDYRIQQASESWGAMCVMTSDKHPSGTDRCAEVLEILGEDCEVAVNIQGDEPFIEAAPLSALLYLFENKVVRIATLVQRIDNEDELADPNNVRVVVNTKGEAMYFSRAAIPYVRGHELKNWLSRYPFLKHIGIYAFRPDVLREIVKLSPSMLEQTEMLEQLRWLENGYTVHTAETDYTMLSVDTPQDMERAEAHYRKTLQVS